MLNRELFDAQISDQRQDGDRRPSAVLQARSLVVEYVNTARRSTRTVTALGGIDFDLVQGRITGLAGASGSGKSTLARCLAGLQRPTGGKVIYRGADIS